MRERRNNLKPFSIIGLKFLDKNGIPSKKTYDYYLDEKMSDYFKLYGNSLSSTSFMIVNEKGYNYRNSEVVVHYWRKLSLEERDDLLFITGVESWRDCLPLESRCYDGSTPFDEKEKDMTLDRKIINKIRINGETYNLSNNTTNTDFINLVLL